MSDIRRGALSFRADAASSAAAATFGSDRFFDTASWGRNAGGMRITPGAAVGLATTYACTTTIGRNIGQMPCLPYRLRASGGKVIDTKNPAYRLLFVRPNAVQSPFQFRMMMQGHVELRGNAYAEIIYDRGTPAELRPLHPDRMRVEPLGDGTKRYVYRDPFLNGRERVLLQDEVLHLYMWTEDGYTGISTVAAAAGVFGTALAQQDYTNRFFQNDARTAQYISGANFKTDEDRKKFLEKWQQQQTGANRHKTAVLPPGMELKELGMKLVDQQLLEARKFSRIEICSLFGVPPHLIGETEKTATYASVEQFNIMFGTQCLLPRAVMWEQALHRDLGFEDDEFVRFDMSAILRGDNATRAAVEAMLIACGVLNPDEAREIEGYNPIPGGLGKDYWRPMNWARLGDASVTAQKALPSSTTDDLDDSEGASARVAGMAKLLLHMTGKTPEQTAEALKRIAEL